MIKAVKTRRILFLNCYEVETMVIESLLVGDYKYKLFHVIQATNHLPQYSVVKLINTVFSTVFLYSNNIKQCFKIEKISKALGK